MAAFAKESVLNRLPIIVILGATGTGKSKLALEVAKKFNGEIISADAMQVYCGLDVVTNKVTAEELQQVPHHMLDYLTPGQPTTVTDFRDRAVPIIDELLSRRKLPVIAGGTNYYVESLLWKVLVDTDKGTAPWVAKRAKYPDSLGGLGRLSHLVTQDHEERDLAKDKVEELNAEDKDKLYEALKKVDPARADELHPNNIRKVIRSLQVYCATGRRHSELIQEQRAAGGNEKGGPLRYPDCAVFWITCDQAVLNERLDARVDQMISQGLIQEMKNFHEQYNRQRVKEEDGELKQPAYTLGIFQSIGFKEFHDYLMLSEQEQISEQGKKLFDKGVELMKIATRQYAKRQVKWIQRRFLARGNDQVPPLYSLNGTDVSQWKQEVRNKAYAVVSAMLEGKPSPLPPEERKAPSKVVHKVVKCEDCDRFFESIDQFREHVVSQKHKRRLQKLKREGMLTEKSKDNEERNNDVKNESSDKEKTKSVPI